jgi:hypothetical protein
VFNFMQSVIVPLETSNPRLPAARADFELLTEENHLTICKPASRTDATYERVRDFCINCASSAGDDQSAAGDAPC